MADIVYPLLESVTPAGVGTYYSSNVFNTGDFRDFSFMLNMPSTAAGSGTLDIYIEESNDPAFTNARDIKVVALTNAADNTTVATKFTQVTGSTTLPAATDTTTPLRQKWEVRNVNLARSIRVRYVVGTANNFTDIQLDLLANKKV